MWGSVYWAETLMVRDERARPYFQLSVSINLTLENWQIRFAGILQVLFTQTRMKRERLQLGERTITWFCALMLFGPALDSPSISLRHVGGARWPKRRLGFVFEAMKPKLLKLQTRRKLINGAQFGHHNQDNKHEIRSINHFPSPLLFRVRRAHLISFTSRVLLLSFILLFFRWAQQSLNFHSFTPSVWAYIELRVRWVQNEIDYETRANKHRININRKQIKLFSLLSCAAAGLQLGRVDKLFFPLRLFLLIIHRSLFAIRSEKERKRADGKFTVQSIRWHRRRRRRAKIPAEILSIPQ